MSSLGEAARQALKNMDIRKYEFQSEFARDYLARGEARGRAALLLRQLAVKFGRVDSQVGEQIQRASIAELDAIGERLLSAPTLRDALGF